LCFSYNFSIFDAGASDFLFRLTQPLHIRISTSHRHGALLALYQPRQADLTRIEGKDNFKHLKGKRFKEELMKDAKKVSKAKR
jgi:hypothetical protein